MNQFEIKEYGKLTKEQKEEAIEVFVEGFGHMLTFSKDNQELKYLFSEAFHPAYIYVYMENDKVLGILGIASNRIRPIKLELNRCISLFGKIRGSIIYKQMNSVFQSQIVKKDTDLYIDVLATSKVARGKGVATQLLEYAFSLPQYEECYIEVLSKNLNAKRLYEKIGFIAYKKKIFYFTVFMGMGYPIRMKRDISSLK